MTSRSTSLLTWIASLHVLVNKVVCVCAQVLTSKVFARLARAACSFFHFRQVELLDVVHQAYQSYTGPQC